jgi:histidinol phosphatase-like enzyme (inositol monophosphatase family)
MTFTAADLSEFKSFIRHAAKESGEIIRNYFRSHIAVNVKPDDSPVTIADLRAEERIRDLIRKEFPDYGIIGEEFGVENEGARYKWVIDALDGTKSFVCGSYDFGSLIALVDHDQPILGAIHQPVLNQLLIGDNNVTELNERQVKVSSCQNLSEAVMSVTDLLNVRKYQSSEKFDHLSTKVKFFRTWGNCFGYSLVATGLIDIMIDPVLETWDSLALIPVIRGAGGVITDYQGSDPAKGNSIVATNKFLHEEVIRILNLT